MLSLGRDICSVQTKLLYTLHYCICTTLTVTAELIMGPYSWFTYTFKTMPGLQHRFLYDSMCVGQNRVVLWQIENRYFHIKLCRAVS